MKNLNIIILAAGKGTRMNSTLPKIFQPIAGKSMVNHILNTVSQLKPNKIFLVINQSLVKYLPDIDEKIELVIQKKQNGTADAIRSCLPKLKNIKGKSLILYADIPLIRIKTLKKVIDLKSKRKINLLTFKKEESNSYGKVILDKQGYISEIIEQKELKKEIHHTLCNSGIFCCTVDVLNNLVPKINNKNKKKEFYLTDIFKLAAANKIVTKNIVGYEEEIMGINDKKELADAEYIVQTNLRDKFLKKGVTLIDPETVYFSYDTKIGKDVVIYPNVFIGNNVNIGNGSIIYSFSHLEDCKVGKSVSIGPYARLRPDTKKSKIRRDSKINHLAYVGDSQVGKNVNIGAGTIICNYDGKNKHQTIIDDGAFIGSNSSLIAPIKIGKNSYVGSGSAISKDVKPDSLAIERTNQIEIKNWSRKIKRK